MTHNLVRDAALGLNFSSTYFYTGQGFLVRQDSGINFISDLHGRTIGLMEGSTSVQNLQDALAKFGGSAIPQIFFSNEEKFAAYNRGDIDAVSIDQSILAGEIPTLTNPDNQKILPDVISKEPLAFVMDENQGNFADVLNCTIYSLSQAEELGSSSPNIDHLITINTDLNLNNDSNY